MTMWWLKRKTLNREILEQRVIVIAKLLLFSPGLWFKMAPSITIKWFYLLRSQSVVESQGCQILTDHRLNTRSDMRISNSSETPASTLGYLQRRGTLLPKATDFFFFFFEFWWFQFSFSPYVLLSVITTFSHLLSSKIHNSNNTAVCKVK